MKSSTSDGATGARTVFTRDRMTPAAVLLLLAALAWVGVLIWARSPSMMDAMPGPVAPTRATLFAAMWLVMMAAMMLPAVTPIVLLFRTVQRSRVARGNLAVPTSSFVGGYLLVWLAAGVAAFLIYALVQSVSPRLHADTGWLPYVGGVIVVLAGIYQLTPLKNVCLRHCRSPIHFLMHGWGEGKLGAFRTGAGHGLFCLGCCWGIMAVLFVVGLMNLGWMAALSLVITIEKLAPRGVTIARGVGGLFIALGALIAFWPSAFAPAGLTMGNTMSMGSPSRPVSTVTAGPYRLTLRVGMAEQLLTPAVAKGTHARSGEIMLGMSAGQPITMNDRSNLRHVEVRIVDRAMGMLVRNARVSVQLGPSHMSTQSIPLMPMYGIIQGRKDYHYGANISISPGQYTAHVRVNNVRASFPIRVH